MSLACGLSNNLARNPDWDPQRHLLPYNLTKVPAQPLPEPSTVPLAAALLLLIPLPINDAPKTKVYIDNMFNCYLHSDLN
jgi:hypothetical protein